MICLTGDVHQEYDSGEQRTYRGTEFEATMEYVDIARSYGIDITLFVTGDAAAANAEQLRQLRRHDGTEIAGHTWNAFRPLWLHRTVFARVFGSVYGPKWYQKRDIRRTLDTIERITGRPVTSWRTHSYKSNEQTYEVLSDTSVTVVSDVKDPDALGTTAYKQYDLVEYPINIIPDHEHLFHGGRTRESVAQLRASGWSDSFGSKSYAIDEWCDRVVTQIDRIEDADGTATLLIHPGCMKAADDLDSFERICAHIASAGYETRTLRNECE